MDQEHLSLLALRFVPGIGDILLKQLVSYCGSADQVFKQSKSKLFKVPGIRAPATESIRRGRTFDLAEKEFKKADRENVQLLFFTDQAYPFRLKNIDDAPSLLYVKGNINLNRPKTISIVGTRQATSYGKQQVESIVRDLVSHQALIISGLAYGIDIHAHKHALKHQLPTVGVLGSGMDVIYPSAHQDVATKMTNQGALVTENPFGTKPDAHNFPARNRIIAGLCDALIVIEAAEKGGALITAEIANTYNKDVFAVPGNLGNTYSEGCNKLIKINKANLIASVKDLEYIMNWNAPGDRGDSQLSLDLSPFSEHEQSVLKVLHERGDPVLIDELCIRTGFTQGFLASLLLTLEFRNAIISLPGKMYKRR